MNQSGIDMEDAASFPSTANKGTGDHAGGQSTEGMGRVEPAESNANAPAATGAPGLITTPTPQCIVPSQNPSAETSDLITPEAELVTEDELSTPKASLYNASTSTRAVVTGPENMGYDQEDDSPTRGLSDLSIHENHFLPLPSQPFSDLSISRSGIFPSPTTASSHRGGGFQSQPTTAISLPEGVLAVQQDGVSSRATSITGAPSFVSDAGSLASLVPTIDARGNDVEGMLGEVLNRPDENVWGLKMKRRLDMANDEIEESIAENTGSGWGVDGEEGSDWDESSDEERDKGLSEDQLIARWRSRKKHFFVLSSAGKPIYSRHGNEQLISGYMGVIQTIISFFQEADDALKSFVAGKHRFCVTREGPIYLVAVSCLGESDQQLRTQLDALYLQIVSTLTYTSLSRLFTNRSSYDLRRALGGTEVFLNGLADAMTRGDPQTLLGALECIKLRKHQREKFNNVLVKNRVPSLLYGMIIADGRLVSVVRPKRHSLHPPDLMLLFSMLFNAATFRNGEEHWTPICLPKFNNKGYLYAYIHFFRKEIALVLMSAEKDAFFPLRGMKEKVLDQLENTNPPLIPVIEATLARDRYSISDILPEQTNLIQHFLYKSRPHVQFTMPSMEMYFQSVSDKRSLMTIYHRLHAATHQRHNHLKVHHCVLSRRGKLMVGLAWVTEGFELYVVASSSGAGHGNERGKDREKLAQGANTIVKWVKKEEERLFVVGGAVF